jgi:hypothetical protein
MPAQFTELDVTSTKLVNFFYPYSKQNKINICFSPTQLIDKDKIEKYVTDFKYTKSDDTVVYLTPEEQSLLVYLFAKGLKKDYEGDKIEIMASPTGKGEDKLEFVWMEYDYKDVIPLNIFHNFTYYNQGSFYTILPQSFRSQLRTEAFDTETNKVDREILKVLIDEKYNSTDKEVWKEVLSTIRLKTSKTTVAKVLISLLPRLPMPCITTLSDFIQSEMISGQGSTVIDPNVIELKGDLITYFYNVYNYRFKEDGNLGSSCMKNNHNTEQIKFYANNPTNVSLLTYIENKKLLARGVLWTDVRGKKYIDRVYSSSQTYATKLVAYCKQHNIDTVHSPTSECFGLPFTRDCVVKLDTFEMSVNNYPYLDTMCAIDVVGGYVSTELSILRTYLDCTSYDYFIKNLNRHGNGMLGYDERNCYVKKGSNKTVELFYPKDAHGNYINSNLNKYALINKPKLALLKRDDIVTINDTDKISGEWCENTLIKKYNSVKPTLLYSTKEKSYTIKYYDKQYIVYSTFHKMNIRKVDASYIPSLQTYVITETMSSDSFKSALRMLQLRKIYGGKLVRITKEGLQNIKDQIRILSFRESLMDIRQSRVYNINVKNILENGIRIKGIIIPFKHLRFVKNESNKNQK